METVLTNKRQTSSHFAIVSLLKTIESLSFQGFSVIKNKAAPEKCTNMDSNYLKTLKFQVLHRETSQTKLTLTGAPEGRKIMW